MTVTKKQYASLDDAAEYLNKKLFGGKLPDIIITLQRKAKVNGYLHFERFTARDGTTKLTELAINPDNFVERTDLEILSTVAHEMVHLLQCVSGEPPRKGYHNKEFAEMMKAIGLYPSATGEVGGRETGQAITHYIIDGGKFEIAANAFLLKGNALFWESLPIPKAEREKKQTRWKYSCPSCNLSAMAKKDAHLMCADCREDMVCDDE